MSKIDSIFGDIKISGLRRSRIVNKNGQPKPDTSGLIYDTASVIKYIVDYYAVCLNRTGRRTPTGSLHCEAIDPMGRKHTQYNSTNPNISVIQQIECSKTITGGKILTVDELYELTKEFFDCPEGMISSALLASQFLLGIDNEAI